MSSYSASTPPANSAVPGWPDELPPAGMVAVRLADLRSPVRGRKGRRGKADRTALVATGAEQITAGEPVVFLKPVVVAPAVVGRNGQVRAAGHPAGHVRLGVLEQQLDEMTGREGTIDELAAGVRVRGKIKRKALRAMTVAVTLRAVVLMTLMPHADYRRVLTTLFGDLPLVPWQRPFAVPTPTVLSTWRQAVGPEPLEMLQQMVCAAAAAEHDVRDWRAYRVAELRLGAIDGTVTRMPDTAANRAAYGSIGTGDDSAPYPQLRDLLISDAATRATLAVVTGPAGGDKPEAEQALLDRALHEHPELFAKSRLWAMDRNFPGVARIGRLIEHTHVLIRVKSDIPIERVGDFLPDGSYEADIHGGGQKLRMRVVEYHVKVEGQQVPEMFCLITDLADYRAYPAAVLAGAYKYRWDGSETALREDKSAITGAGPSTGPMLRSGSPAMIRQEHAAWIAGTELVRAAARTATLAAAPAGKGRRAGMPVHPREISFTAARRAVIESVATGTATAGLPEQITTRSRHTVLAGIARCRITVDRNRHREHKTKARQPFPAAGRNTPTRTAPARIGICRPLTT